MDTNGKILGEKLAKNKSVTIDLSDLVKPLAKGMYFVKIQSPLYTKTDKIIRK